MSLFLSRVVALRPAVINFDGGRSVCRTCRRGLKTPLWAQLLGTPSEAVRAALRANSAHLAPGTRPDAPSPVVSELLLQAEFGDLHDGEPPVRREVRLWRFGQLLDDGQHLPFAL